MKRVLVFTVVLLAPSALIAQTPTRPNEHASDRAKERVAFNIARHATHTRGEAVGLDNRPVTPAVPATRATRAVPAVPHPGDGTPATRAVPAVPAKPATPASPSHRPPDAGSGRGRRP